MFIRVLCNLSEVLRYTFILMKAVVSFYIIWLKSIIPVSSTSGEWRVARVEFRVRAGVRVRAGLGDRVRVRAGVRIRVRLGISH